MTYETRCFKIKLKPDSLELARDWASAINQRNDEALETLRYESVVLETVFLDRTSEGDFLIYLMKAESFENANNTAERSAHAIDKLHKEFKRGTCENKKQLEVLIDLENFP